MADKAPKNTPAAPEAAPEAAPAGILVESNNAFTVEDNTEVEAVEEPVAETEEVELVDGIVQVNYK